jgi:hypothetical protein
MFYFGCYLSAQAEMVNAFLQSRMAELMERFTVTLGDGTGWQGALECYEVACKLKIFGQPRMEIL